MLWTSLATLSSLSNFLFWFASWWILAFPRANADCSEADWKSLNSLSENGLLLLSLVITSKPMSRPAYVMGATSADISSSKWTNASRNASWFFTSGMCCALPLLRMLPSIPSSAGILLRRMELLMAEGLSFAFSMISTGRPMSCGQFLLR